MSSVQLPDELAERCRDLAEQMGLTLEELLVEALNTWASHLEPEALVARLRERGSLLQPDEQEAVAAVTGLLDLLRRELLIDAVVATGIAHRGVVPEGTPPTPDDWVPPKLPGKPVSEIIIEDRGPR